VKRLRGLPTGAFVVRQSNTIPNAFILSYRHGHKTHHVVLPWDRDGVCLVQSSKVMRSLRARLLVCVHGTTFERERADVCVRVRVCI